MLDLIKPKFKIVGEEIVWINSSYMRTNLDNNEETIILLLRASENKNAAALVATILAAAEEKESYYEFIKEITAHPPLSLNIANKLTIKQLTAKARADIKALENTSDTEKIWEVIHNLYILYEKLRGV